MLLRDAFKLRGTLIITGSIFPLEELEDSAEDDSLEVALDDELLGITLEDGSLLLVDEEEGSLDDELLGITLEDELLGTTLEDCSLLLLEEADTPEDERSLLGSKLGSLELLLFDEQAPKIIDGIIDNTSNALIFFMFLVLLVTIVYFIIKSPHIKYM